MNYLIFDLEWNNTFGREVNINEIIEIGAVLLDHKLKEIGRFSTFVLPRQNSPGQSPERRNFHKK